MRRGRLVILVGSCLAACSAFGGGDEPSSPPTRVDAGGEAGSSGGDGQATDGPASGFLVTLDPPHVAADPGDHFEVTLRLVRAASFPDVVEFTVAGT